MIRPENVDRKLLKSIARSLENALDNLLCFYDGDRARRHIEDALEALEVD